MENLGGRMIQNLENTGKNNWIPKKLTNFGNKEENRGRRKTPSSKYSKNKLIREHKPQQPATKKKQKNNKTQMSACRPFTLPLHPPLPNTTAKTQQIPHKR